MSGWVTGCGCPKPDPWTLDSRLPVSALGLAPHSARTLHAAARAPSCRYRRQILQAADCFAMLRTSTHHRSIDTASLLVLWPTRRHLTRAQKLCDCRRLVSADLDLPLSPQNKRLPTRFSLIACRRRLRFSDSSSSFWPLLNIRQAQRRQLRGLLVLGAPQSPRIPVCGRRGSKSKRLVSTYAAALGDQEGHVGCSSPYSS